MYIEDIFYLKKILKLREQQTSVLYNHQKKNSN